MRLRILLKSESGAILLVTIWIMIILTVLAVGIGHRNRIGINLSRFSIDKMKSYYIAKAGLLIAIQELQNDIKDYDTLYECGISLDEEETLEGVFKDIAVGDGFCSVGLEEKRNFSYGFIDEERKINLNGINAQNYKVFQNLLESLDVDSQDAEIISNSVADWRDSDSHITNSPYGAEDDYYMALDKSYHCKNSRFETTEELFLVRGMNKEIFLKIKDYITVFPTEAFNLKLNVNTSPKLSLQALADEALSHLANVSASDADSLVNKIIDYRSGDDKIEKTEDDKLINLADVSGLKLLAPEETLFNYLRKYFITKSDYFCINSRGTYKDRKVISDIEVVLSRDELSPIYWHEQ